jgi:hypothetical protein
MVANAGDFSGDTMQGQANHLAQGSLNLRQQFAEPQGWQPDKINNGVGGGTTLDGTNLPNYYNQHQAYPKKFAIPTQQKERLMARQEVRDQANSVARDAANPPNVQRTDPITDEEVSYQMNMKSMLEFADFDAYCNTLFDPRKPGVLPEMMRLAPHLIDKPMQQVKTDYDFALRNQVIDMFGVQTPEDLEFKFMVDQGKLKGPSLLTERDASEGFTSGPLSVWKFIDRMNDRGPTDNIKAPFDSAKWGPRPAAPGGWKIKRNAIPLGSGMEPNMFDKPVKAGIKNWLLPTTAASSSASSVPR